MDWFGAIQIVSYECHVQHDGPFKAIKMPKLTPCKQLYDLQDVTNIRPICPGTEAPLVLTSLKPSKLAIERNPEADEA